MAGFCKIAKETLWPLRAENFAMLALLTVKFDGGWSSLTINRIPVKVENWPVTFGGARKSERISGVTGNCYLETSKRNYYVKEEVLLDNVEGHGAVKIEGKREIIREIRET